MTELEELKKQLEEAQMKNEKSELQLKFTDKNTGLWNKKYLDQLIEENHFDLSDHNFTAVVIRIDNMQQVNTNEGSDAGDKLLADLGSGLMNNFKEPAICLKLVGTKFCVLLTEKLDELNNLISSNEQMLAGLKEQYPDADFGYGFARMADYTEDDVYGLIQEAEYDMHMKSADRQLSDDEVADIEKKRAIGRAKGGHTILMIDDSMVMLHMLQAMLGKKYKFLMSLTGMEGFNIAKDKQPDLILLDYNMPIVDGRRILELLKKTPETMDIPVVFITGVNDRQKIVEVAALNPAGYLLKPVNQQQLITTVEKLIG